MLGTVLDSVRLNRMWEQDAVPRVTRGSYSMSEMLEELRRGLWRELRDQAVTIEPLRRAIQNEYVTMMVRRAGDTTLVRDARAQVVGDLEALSGEIAAALPRVQHRPTRLHLSAARRQSRAATEAP